MSPETLPLAFGRAICGDLAQATQREWLVTDGLGGYAFGTIAGEQTRKYHGLLIAATSPPGRRVLLLSALDVEVTVGGVTTRLATHRWADNTIDPRGYLALERFELEGLIPTWTWAIGGALLQQRVWMRHGEPTTFVRWTLLRGSSILLRAKALTTHRSHHAPDADGGPAPRVENVDGGVRVIAFDGATPLLLRAGTPGGAEVNGAWEPGPCDLYRGLRFTEETARGYDAIDSVHHSATVHATLACGESVTILASATSVGAFDGAAALTREHERQAALIERAPAATDEAIRAVHGRLVLAADQFMVRRPRQGGEGYSIVAGYPWFEDWGRDTMISLPGLCLATGRVDEAVEILRTYAGALSEGMLPNRFPDEGGQPEYNTVDATLWFVVAMQRTIDRLDRANRARGDALVRELWPALESIITAHQRGTRHGIHVDPADGLLRAGEPGVQLTWMDAKCGDWVVTPRIGKPVEIQALWIAALRTLADLAPRAGAGADLFVAAAEKAASAFARFWRPAEGCLFDVLDGPGGDDPSIRPNQVIAAGLRTTPLTPEQRRSIVACCTSQLLTSHGLRTLAPTDPRYQGIYAGDQRTRDGAYHQGTVWPWPLASLVAAMRLAGEPESRVADIVRPLILHLADAGIGSVSEVFDGDAPHRAGGCVAQAWSVAAVLEVIEVGVWLTEGGGR